MRQTLSTLRRTVEAIDGNQEFRAVFGTIIRMKTTINLDDALVRDAIAIHQGKTKTAVLELGQRELINADRGAGWATHSVRSPIRCR